jgi:predicted lipid-binding transport protein (Tim44 family)
MRMTEHRQAPRIAMQALAYVNLEPESGGIIVNLSEGGLCFQAATPVQRPGTVRFWLSHRDHGIEAESELMWTAEGRKRGGLRFTHLSPEAREEIRTWISQHGVAVSTQENVSSSFASPHSAPSLSADRLDPTTTSREPETVGRLSLNQPGRRLLTGFSGGLTVGILASAFVGGVFLLNAHRRDLGESLIRLGERLGGRTQTEGASREPQQLSPDMQQASPEPQRLSSATLRIASEASPAASNPPVGLSERLRVISDPKPPPIETKGVAPEQPAVTPETRKLTPEPQTALPTQVPDLRPEGVVSQPAVETSKPEAVKLQTMTAVPVVDLPNSNAMVSSVATAGPTTMPQPSSPANDTAPRSGAGAGTSSGRSAGVVQAANPLMASGSQPALHIEQVKPADTGSLSEKFLEVGKFKEKVWADKTTVKLSEFGYPVKVIPKSSAWKKSYQVVVGPFGTDPEAEAAHRSLASNGFEPRSFERGARGFRFPRTLKVAGTSVPMGDCTIRWESYMPDAIVKIESRDGGSVTAEGTWVKRGPKYGDDAVVYMKNVDGSQSLVEIRFSGMGQVLVFGKGRF